MTGTTILTDPSKRLAVFAFGAALILTAAFTMNAFDEGATWEAFDYAMLGVLLFGAILMFEVAARVFRSANRLKIAAVVGVFALLVMIELAVGLVGTPAAGS